MIRKEDLNIEPYLVRRNGYRYKLDANESFFDFDKSERKIINDMIEMFEFKRYPDCFSGTIGEILTKIHDNTLPDNFLIGNGSDEILYYLFSAYRDRRMVLLDIEYPVYFHLAKLFKMEVHSVELTENLDMDATWGFTIKKYKPDLVVLSYPNNPLGKSIGTEMIISTIQNNQDTFFVIDEAYYHYSGKSFENKIKECNNLAILRTFSKAFAMASLRIGYIYSQECNIEVLKKYKLPFNVSLLSQTVFSTVYGSLNQKVQERVDKVKNEKNRIRKRLTKNNWIRVYDSETNFLFCECIGFSVKKLDQYLRQNSILILSGFSQSRIKNCFRYTIGTEQENNFFLECLECFIDSL